MGVCADGTRISPLGLLGARVNEHLRSLLVADSFRVRVNPVTSRSEVRGWRNHLERFRTGVESVLPSMDRSSFDTFLAEATRAIQDYGEGFPRLELWGTPGAPSELSFALRPLPPLGTEIELCSAPGTVLDTPSLKGPNIARLAALNQQLGREALLTDTAGCVLEGATTSLIWWCPADQNGYVVANQESRVASVTEALLGEIVPLTPRSIHPSELRGQEVWAINALHGIRVVTAIDGVPAQQPDQERLGRYQRALDRRWDPLAPG